jgi:hypothetical protein
MQSSRSFILSILAMVACLFTACQSGSDMKYYNFPDAVTSINQVDPAYRKYFVDQQGRNYSADDQRKALAAAIRTSRTPVPAYVPRSAMASTSKATRRRVVTRKSTARRNARYASNKRKVSSSRRVAYKKSTRTAPKKRAVAKRKTTKRRRG